jgi:hypothetical protein
VDLVLCLIQVHGSAGTVGHGLGVTPEMFNLQNKQATNDWMYLHSVLGNTSKMRFKHN